MPHSFGPRAGISHPAPLLTILKFAAAPAGNPVRADHAVIHYNCEDTGYAVLLVEPGSGVAIGLHTNRDNAKESFDECRTGLDHVSFGVASRDELAAWLARLDEFGVEHTGIRDEKEPFPFSTVVFRDPDSIQLELIWQG